MISGGGVVIGDAFDEAIAISEQLGLPVVNSYLHNDSFPALTLTGVVLWVTRVLKQV